MKKNYISPNTEYSNTLVLDSLLVHSFFEVDSKRRGDDCFDEDEEDLEMIEESQECEGNLWSGI